MCDDAPSVEFSVCTKDVDACEEAGLLIVIELYDILVEELVLLRVLTIFIGVECFSICD